MISPQGTVWLGHVPWDSSYRHVYYEGMVDKSAILGAFMTLRTDAYTYIREDTNIRVPYNADSIYGVNYCMYQNDGMWFCAFVNTITYVNNGTSLLHLEEDVWHTWGENLVWHTCYIEREHVSQDNLGQWRAPEPSMALESITIGTHQLHELDVKSVVIQCNAVPHFKSGQSDYFAQHSENDFDGSDSVGGEFVGGTYQGCTSFVFGSSSYVAAGNFLDNMNKCGAADAIAGIFMIPSIMVSEGAGHRVTNGQSMSYDSFVEAPQVAGGNYQPRNKKVLTFPYCYATMSNHNGSEMDIKYEDCDVYGHIAYELEMGVDPTAACYMRLLEHAGSAAGNDSLMIPLSVTPHCSWINDAYQNWLAQNHATVSTTHVVNGTQAVIGVGAMFVGIGLMLTGAGVLPGAASVLSGLGVTGSVASGAAMTAGGTMALLSAEKSEAQLDAQSKVPSQTSGATSNNSLHAVGMNGSITFHALQLDSARRLDWFFDVFGYQIDQIRLPNITSRPSWNYLKTMGASLNGDIPADRLAIINKCLDGGMTFWHTTDVGNYGLNNAL